MEPRLIRISAFVLAAVILLGSLSIWAVSTQDTATADVGDVYDINVEPNDEVENILSNTTISDDDEFGDINENKTLFTLIFDEDYPETYVNGTINLYNTHEISQYLHDLNLKLEANGEEVGWLGLSMGYARFEVSRELGETEMQISTTGDGGHTMRQAGEFELGFLVDINEKQKSVGSQEEITEVAEEYELRVDMNVDGTLVVDGETFDILPYEDEYEEDTEVELEAIPDEDVEFIEWDGIDTDDDNQTTITMDEDYDVTAVFETDVELTIDSTDGGEVDVPGEGTFTYDAGQEVNLEAVADEGHYFVEWAGDVDTIDDTDATETTIEMLDDYSITANFAPETYFLTVNIDGQGTVEVDGDEIDDGDTLEYEYGTIVDIEAIADDGWTFDEWLGDNDTITDPTENHTTIEMLDNYTVTAEFIEAEGSEFVVTITDTNDPISEGEDLVVEVEVENWGDIEDKQDIVMLDFNGDEVDRYDDLELESGETETVTLIWNTQEGDGSRDNIEVFSEDTTDTEVVIITRIAVNEEEDGSVGDPYVWEDYWDIEDVYVEGLDEIYLRYHFDLTGTTAPGTEAEVRILIDGNEVMYENEDGQYEWEDYLEIPDSSEEEVNIQFQYRTETTGISASEVEIYEAAYEYIPSDENTAEATGTTFEQIKIEESEKTSVESGLMSGTAYDNLPFEKANNSNQGGINDVHFR